MRISGLQHASHYPTKSTCYYYYYYDYYDYYDYYHYYHYYHYYYYYPGKLLPLYHHFGAINDLHCEHPRLAVPVPCPLTLHRILRKRSSEVTAYLGPLFRGDCRQ